MGGNRELLDGEKWEWDLSFRWEWEWDGNGNEVTEMGGNWDEKSIPAHLYFRPQICSPSQLVTFVQRYVCTKLEVSTAFLF